ncbi:MAG: VacB/RNase II family 3'-5' exoribonuclease, partial [Alicyclobacillus sp.]|nr:VacB/RNase II family 3'-5' exoribonuclease [Alicyclobacillus sp.]
EAYRRGTSVYLVDRVIPMLPPRLSNHICSLNPQVDRLTLTCEMEFTPGGERVRHEIYPSVIRTTERMTYTAVNQVLAGEPAAMARYAALQEHFQRMQELALTLRRRRMERGAIDFDFDEVKVVVDDLGHPLDIIPRTRGVAERIIEEFMLAANETVAEHFYWLEVPFIYRIHEDPDMDKMVEFNEFIHNFGYHVKGLGSRVHPRALQAVLERCKGTREERVIATLMLRSMRQARYAPECVGHFGLAAEYYTHFTSPIRRYPDLVVHRIIREVLCGKLTEARWQRLQEFVGEAAAHSSERERIAQDAERETDQLKMVEYMLDHIGEEFDGLISGVTQFGLFIQLANGVEGLIHISFLTDDYYVLNEKQMALVGERTRRVFRLGDPVRVRVTGANKEDLTVDFELVAHLREGTLVWDDGVASVVYDEDLSPRERRKAVAERAARALRRPAGRRSPAAGGPGMTGLHREGRRRQQTLEEGRAVQGSGRRRTRRRAAGAEASQPARAADRATRGGKASGASAEPGKARSAGKRRRSPLAADSLTGTGKPTRRAAKAARSGAGSGARTELPEALQAKPSGPWEPGV